MVIRVPSYSKRDLSDDPWITLAEAVRWAAWRGNPEPQYGSHEFENGTWVSLGDMDEQDRQVYAHGAEEVRKALAAGRLDAWAQSGYDEPVHLPRARWSGQILGTVVSWVEYYHPYDRIIVEHSVVVQLWPSNLAGHSLQARQENPASERPVTPEQFDEAKADWLELWQGPLNFRATYDKGKFGLGHSLERINQFGEEGATSGGRYVPIYSVRLDPDDGAIVIEWLVGLPGRQHPYQSLRYYHAGLGRGLYTRLRDDADFRDQYLAQLPPDQRVRAVGAYATGISMREWAEREFFYAVHAGHCEIWARVGSKVAPFRRIPADIFRSFEIQEWGFGVPGGAWAKLEGAQPLYSIRVAQADREAGPTLPSNHAKRSPAVKAGRPPNDDEVLAKADEMKARGLDGRTIAKEMRLEPGFDNVATTAVRDLIKGRWKPAGRPKKTA